MFLVPLRRGLAEEGSGKEILHTVIAAITRYCPKNNALAHEEPRSCARALPF